MNMEIILLERIARLGTMGEKVTVKPGFARNFLIPQGKALPATAANLEKFNAQKDTLEAQSLDAKKAAEAVAESLKEVSLTVTRQASETGYLYGSIKARDIADALTAKGQTVSRSSIQIGEPIKEVGEYTVRVALHPEVIVRVPVNVERQQSA